MEHEEIYWEEMSRASWLKHGDKNFKFFHRKASQRIQVNSISSITNDNGIVHSDLEDVGNVITNYFSNLFYASNTFQVEEVVALVQKKIDN